MEARREAQSEAWEAILRTAGGDVDFDLDDLVALKDRAQAEFDRTRAGGGEGGNGSLNLGDHYRPCYGMSAVRAVTW